MAKEFIKTKKTTNPIAETEVSTPKNTFDFETFVEDTSKNAPIKKPKQKKEKVYSTVRIQKENIYRINALQGLLGEETQDTLVSHLLDVVEDNLDDEQRKVYNTFLEFLTLKDKKNNL